MVPHVEQELITLSGNLRFLWGSFCSIFSFMCNYLQIFVDPSVLFLFAIILYVLLFTAFDYPFGILDLRLLITPFGILDLRLLITPLVSSDVSMRHAGCVSMQGVLAGRVCQHAVCQHAVCQYAGCVSMQGVLACKGCVSMQGVLACRVCQHYLYNYCSRNISRKHIH